MSELDLLLYRPLRDGKKFEKLIPYSSCEASALGNGMTDFSVKEMAKMVKRFTWHMKKVAPLLKKSSLQQTCNAIHDFAYSHFQYKADTDVQYLRSPACSWHVRYDGIDCKSYSIIASCVLLNLGIDHYIRRIKQPGLHPDLWTHVYVVVPKDQKTGDLDKGYYTVDGTVATPTEGPFTQKSDLFMSMQHVGLARPQQEQGLGAVSFNDIPGFSTIKGMFSKGWSLSCIGGTHTYADFDKTLASFIPWFNNAFKAVNDAIAANSPEVMALANKLMTNSQQVAAHSTSYAGHNWDSGCSKAATKSYKELGAYYNDMVLKAFRGWLETYFTVTYKNIDGIKRGGYDAALKSEFTKSSFNGGSISVINIASLVLKPETKEIKAFEVTPYAQNKDNYSNFDVSKFLGTLNKVAAVFNVGGSSGNGSGSGSDGNYEKYDPSKTPVTTNSMGIVGGIAILALAGYAFSKMPDKGPGAAKTRSSSSKKTKA
ncbi:hypothetical protein [Flavobacterium sp.]|uniref:hypothetical protein n=1 Tax=Flavobacterium sp. TaxID=239 RepID=UPI00403444EF